MKCIFSKQETTRNFKGLPIHQDILEVARDLRDKKKTTLREVLMNGLFIKEIFIILGKRNKWAKILYPRTHIGDGRIISPHPRTHIGDGRIISPPVNKVIVTPTN